MDEIRGCCRERSAQRSAPTPGARPAEPTCRSRWGCPARVDLPQAWESKPDGCRLADTSLPATHAQPWQKRRGGPDHFLHAASVHAWSALVPCHVQQRRRQIRRRRRLFQQPFRIGRRGAEIARGSCPSLCAAGKPSRRMRPSGCPPCPLAGCRRTRRSIDVISCFSTHHPLRSTGFHRLPRYYGVIRLLSRHRARVVASLASTAGGPGEISWGKDEQLPAASVPNTVLPRLDIGRRVAGTLAQTGRPYGASLAFGAAVRLGLPSHTPSRLQPSASYLPSG